MVTVRWLTVDTNHPKILTLVTKNDILFYDIVVIMESATKILISTFVSIVTITVFWPPYSEYNLWDILSQYVGDKITLLVAFLILVCVSVLMGLMLSFNWKFITVGSVISYILIVSFVELNIQTDSPVHIVAYAVFILIWLVSFVFSNRYINSESFPI